MQLRPNNLLFPRVAPFSGKTKLDDKVARKLPCKAAACAVWQWEDDAQRITQSLRLASSAPQTARVVPRTAAKRAAVGKLGAQLNAILALGAERGRPASKGTVSRTMDGRLASPDAAASCGLLARVQRSH